MRGHSTTSALLKRQSSKTFPSLASSHERAGIVLLQFPSFVERDSHTADEHPSATLSALSASEGHASAHNPHSPPSVCEAHASAHSPHMAFLHLVQTEPPYHNRTSCGIEGHPACGRSRRTPCNATLQQELHRIHPEPPCRDAAVCDISARLWCGIPHRTPGSTTRSATPHRSTCARRA